MMFRRRHNVKLSIPELMRSTRKPEPLSVGRPARIQSQMRHCASDRNKRDATDDVVIVQECIVISDSEVSCPNYTCEESDLFVNEPFRITIPENLRKSITGDGKKPNLQVCCRFAEDRHKPDKPIYYDG